MYSLLREFLEEDQATLISIMLSTIPLSYLMSKLRNKYLIFGISFIFSVVFQSIMFPEEKYFLWAQQQIVYLFLVFCPRKIVGSAILIESFIFLCGIQIRRMYISYAVNGVDITAILMMQVFLYVGVGYNYQHGMKKENQLTQDANRRKIVERPDYLTYMGYVFFLPSCMVGPVFEYRDYQDYLNRRGDYQQIPNTAMAGVKQLGIFIMTVVIYVALSRFELFYTVTEEFTQQSLWYKLGYIGIAIIQVEFKYISAWSLGMISVHLSGLSYNAQKKTFDKIQVTSLWGFFFDPSLKVKAECWNMPIQTALKRYIYETIYDPMGNYKNNNTRRKVQAKAQMYTLMTSALWHGLYPGYYVSFFHWMLFLRINQEIYRIRKKVPAFNNLWPKFKLDFFENIVSQYVLVYFGVFFHVMTWANIKTILWSTYAVPFWILYTTHILVVELKLLSILEKKQSKLEAVKTE